MFFFLPLAYAYNNNTEPLITEKLMSGKILLQWRHSLCSELAKARYTNPERTRAVHTEIANLFFNQDSNDDSGDDTSSERSTAKSGKYRDIYVAGIDCPAKWRRMLIAFIGTLMSLRNVLRRVHMKIMQLKTINLCLFARVAFVRIRLRQRYRHGGERTGRRRFVQHPAR